MSSQMEQNDAAALRYLVQRVGKNPSFKYHRLPGKQPLALRRSNLEKCVGPDCKSGHIWFTDKTDGQHCWLEFSGPNVRIWDDHLTYTEGEALEIRAPNFSAVLDVEKVEAIITQTGSNRHLCEQYHELLGENVDCFEPFKISLFLVFNCLEWGGQSMTPSVGESMGVFWRESGGKPLRIFLGEGKGICTLLSKNYVTNLADHMSRMSSLDSVLSTAILKQDGQEEKADWYTFYLPCGCRVQRKTDGLILQHQFSNMSWKVKTEHTFDLQIAEENEDGTYPLYAYNDAGLVHVWDFKNCPPWVRNSKQIEKSSSSVNQKDNQKTHEQEKQTNRIGEFMLFCGHDTGEILMTRHRNDKMKPNFVTVALDSVLSQLEALDEQSIFHALANANFSLNMNMNGLSKSNDEVTLVTFNAFPVGTKKDLSFYVAVSPNDIPNDPGKKDKVLLARVPWNSVEPCDSKFQEWMNVSIVQRSDKLIFWRFNLHVKPNQPSTTYDVFRGILAPFISREHL